MTNEETQEVVAPEVSEELDLDLDVPEKVETPKEAPKPKLSLEQRKAMLEGQLKRINKDLGVQEAEPAKSTGKLDETQLDYLDLKGISEPEDIKVIETVMKNTGKSLRDTLKDGYVISTIDENRRDRSVRGAIPGSSKRAGIESNSVEFYVNRFKSTGQLPTDFETRSKVVDAITAEDSSKVPGFMRNL